MTGEDDGSATTATPRLTLTDEQRLLLADHSGRNIRSVPLAPALAAAVDLHLQAEALGHRFPYGDGVVTLDLTPTQQDEVFVATGLRLTRWAFDVDAGETRYAEAWSEVTHEISPRVRVSVSSTATAADADVRAGDGAILLRSPAPGDAVFGTGRHPATRLAVRLLEEHVQPGDHVADIGTGSGILALVALRLGAADVVAVDTDPQALAAARENLEVNAASDRVVLLRDRLRPEDVHFDVVVGNLLAGVITELLPSLAPVVREGGHLLFSGIATRRVAGVVDVATTQGLRPAGELEEGVWSALAFRRPGGSG